MTLLKGVLVGAAVALFVIWLLVVFVETFALAHDSEVRRCFDTSASKGVKMVKEVVNENGTISELYDRNGDGKIDIEAISAVFDVHMTDGSIAYIHQDHPIMYVVDMDFDGEPDVTMIDTKGEGECSSIAPYQNLHRPSMENKDLPEHKQTGG